MDIQIHTNKDKHHKIMHPCMGSDLKMSWWKPAEESRMFCSCGDVPVTPVTPVPSSFVMFNIKVTNETVLLYLAVCVLLTPNTSTTW